MRLSLPVFPCTRAAGPAVRRARRRACPSGWLEDQRWTLPRVAKVITERFGVSHPGKGTSLLLHRMGFSVQVPVHRAAERDETTMRHAM
jgi:transposase